jgi:predicted kinase
MAGHPASGKTTVARAVAARTGAVLLDKDVIKSPMVESGLPNETSGPLAYDVFMAVGRSIAEQRISVILDSPAFYPIIIERGRRIAEETGAAYYIIECECEHEELQRRLDSRPRMASQLDYVVNDPYNLPGAAPITEPRLVLRTDGDIEECVERAVAYMSGSTVAASSP